MFRNATSLQDPPVVAPAVSRSARPRPTRLIPAFSIVAGIIGAACILLLRLTPAPEPAGAAIEEGSSHHKKNANFDAPPPGASAIRPLAIGLRSAYSPTRAPLYLANLADTRQGFEVGVRNTFNPQYRLNGNPRSPEPPRFSQPLQISLQIMPLAPKDGRRLPRFSNDATLTDDRGRVWSQVGPADAYEFAGGQIRVLSFAELPPDVKYIRSLDGTFQVTENALGPRPGGTMPSSAPSDLPQTTPGTEPAKTTRIAFHIKNMPLPWRPHILGMAGAALLAPRPRSAAQKVTAAANGVIEGDAINGLLSDMPEAAFLSPGLKLSNRLILQPGQTNSFDLAVASDTPGPDAPPVLHCALTPELRADGEMQAALDIRRTDISAAPYHTTLRIWDDSPCILRIPAERFWPEAGREPQGKKELALYLHLFLDPDRAANYLPGALPARFLARKGDRGGSLTGAARIADRPLPGVIARVRFDALDPNGNKVGEGLEMEIALDQEGTFQLGNMTAGTYRLTLLDMRQVVAGCVNRTTFTSYAARRYQIQHLVWKNNTQEFVMSPGGHVALRPFFCERQPDK